MNKVHIVQWREVWPVYLFVVVNDVQLTHAAKVEVKQLEWLNLIFTTKITDLMST